MCWCDVTNLPSPCLPAVCCGLFWPVGSLGSAWFWSGLAADPKHDGNSAAGQVPTQNITGTNTIHKPNSKNFIINKNLKRLKYFPLLYLLTVSLLVLEFLLQCPSAAFSIVPLATHLLSDLF